MSVSDIPKPTPASPPDVLAEALTESNLVALSAERNALRAEATYWHDAARRLYVALQAALEDQPNSATISLLRPSGGPVDPPGRVLDGAWSRPMILASRSLRGSGVIWTEEGA